MKCNVCGKEVGTIYYKGRCIECFLDNFKDEPITKIEPCDVKNKKIDNVTRFKEITFDMRSVYEAKNSDYGDSFSRTFDRLGLVSSVVRLMDKLNRLETLCTKDAKVKDESIKDTLLDMANYSIMTIIELEKRGE